MERTKTWWREDERREWHCRMHLYYELGSEHPEEEWLVSHTVPTSCYYLRLF